MPVRNLWSLEPGECVTAEEILKKLRDCEVYFPLHDVGVDLLIVKGNKHVGVQVKESRYYFGHVWRSGHRGHSWHQVRKDKLMKDRDKADFYIFLTYLPRYGEHRLSRFENKFLIVPTKDLERRVKIKDPGKRGVYSFYFHFEGLKVWDERVVYKNEDVNKLMDYSEYLDAWDLLRRALNK